MTDDIIRKATTADYIETIDNLRAEVKRLRSQSVEQVFRRKNEQIASKDARIKELEEANRNIDKRRDEMAAFIERLEAAFLKLYVNQLVGCNMPREVAEKHAREALERIRNGE